MRAAERHRSAARRCRADRASDAIRSVRPTAVPRCLMTSGRNQPDRKGGVVTRNFASWNLIGDFLSKVAALRRAA